MKLTQTNSINGFQYLWRGFELLVHPRIRHYVIIPFLINILLFTITLILLIHWFGDFTHWLRTLLPHWLQWLNWLLWPLFILVSVIVVFYISIFIGNIIASPFNSLLSERIVELHLGKKPNTDNGILNLFKQIPVSLYREMRKLLYYLPRAILCLILFVIPVVQIGAAVIWFLFNAWTMSMQFLDYPAENEAVSFPELRKKMQQKRAVNFAFGSAVVLIMMIPIINFIVIPAATAGATLLWLEQYSYRE